MKRLIKSLEYDCQWMTGIDAYYFHWIGVKYKDTLQYALNALRIAMRGLIIEVLKIAN